MADNNPSLPGGALPPKPAEGAKVQPKKETVRINLPPKPSAAPTIKLPTLPPGGPTAAASPIAAAAPPAAAAPAPLRSAAAPVAAAAAAAPVQRPVQRPVAAPVAAISTLDKALAICAAVAGLIAIGSTIFCMMLFKD